MASRRTTAGSVLEQMILPSLRHGRYTYDTQVEIGRRPGGRRHVADAVIRNRSGEKILISVKWQQVSGTAEQKVPFEVICLIDIMRRESKRYNRAYLVLGGAGWSLREFYVGGGLNQYLKHDHMVKIITLEAFIGKANQGRL